jgi:hypothetical protein
VQILGPLLTVGVVNQLYEFVTVALIDGKLAHLVCETRVERKMPRNGEQIVSVDGVIEHWLCQPIECLACTQARIQSLV